MIMTTIPVLHTFAAPAWERDGEDMEWNGDACMISDRIGSDCRDQNRERRVRVCGEFVRLFVCLFAVRDLGFFFLSNPHAEMMMVVIV